MFSAARAACGFARAATVQRCPHSVQPFVARTGRAFTTKSFDGGVEGVKSAVAFTAPSADSVARAFGVFNEFGVECTSVSSKPDTFTGAQWFTVDFVGKPTDERVRQCFDRLSRSVGDLQFKEPILGELPEAAHL